MLDGIWKMLKSIILHISKTSSSQSTILRIDAFEQTGLGMPAVDGYTQLFDSPLSPAQSRRWLRAAISSTPSKPPNAKSEHPTAQAAAHAAGSRPRKA